MAVCFYAIISSLNVVSVTNPFCDKHQIGVAGSDYGGFIWSLNAGIRYRFSEHVGIFAELGYGISILNLGLNFKF